MRPRYAWGWRWNRTDGNGRSPCRIEWHAHRGVHVPRTDDDLGVPKRPAANQVTEVSELQVVDGVDAMLHAREAGLNSHHSVTASVCAHRAQIGLAQCQPFAEWRHDDCEGRIAYLGMATISAHASGVMPLHLSGVRHRRTLHEEARCGAFEELSSGVRMARLARCGILAGLIFLGGAPVSLADPDPNSPPGRNASLELPYTAPTRPPAIEWASVTLRPDTAEATNVQWDILLAIAICGTPGIGSSVLVPFLPPISLPESIPAESVWFDGRPAALSVAGDTLRVAPDLAALPSFCLHDRPFRFPLVFLSEAGFSNPQEPGTYLVEIATDDNPAALSVPVVVRDPA